MRLQTRHFFIGLATLLLGWFAVTAVGAAQTKVLNTRWLETSAEKQQLVLDLSEPVKHSVFTLPAEGGKPERVVIDLSNAQLVGDLLEVPKNIPMLQAVRSGTHNENDDLRLVIDVNQSVYTHSFLLKPSGRNGHRLVVIIAKQHRPDTPLRLAAARQAEAMALLPPTAPSQAAAYVTPLTPMPLPSGGGKNQRELVIAIDAGHGGIDPGAIGQLGTYEKTVVLAIARELALLVRQTPGMKAALIRNDDSYLKLRDRIARARQYQADIFISIHADANESGQQMRGASVYVLSQRGASSEAAHWLAEKENAADLLGGVSLNDKNDTLASILLDLSQTGTLEASGQLAQQVLSGLSGVGAVHHKNVQQAAFMVLRSPDIPSILVETAFISNAAEERKLRDKAYQRQIAQAIFQGIRAYMRQHPALGTQVAQR